MKGKDKVKGYIVKRRKDGTFKKWCKQSEEGKRMLKPEETKEV